MRLAEQTPDAALEAFSKQSTVFDAIDAAFPLITRMRDIVRQHALAHMRPGETVLELNAGTGIDSTFFAQRGMDVLATDAAPGMVAQLKEKQLRTPHLSVQACSFLHLEQLGDRKFHHVFSNFGGLNCTDQLDRVLRGIDEVLLPGGTCTLVIMPRFSPWELLTLLKGDLRMAFRRWRTTGTTAHVEGVYFPCYYYSPQYVKKHLGAGYTVLEQRALSLTVPPPHQQHFTTRWPRLYRLLHAVEEAVAHRWPFRNWGDHFLIILQKR